LRLRELLLERSEGSLSRLVLLYDLLLLTAKLGKLALVALVLIIACTVLVRKVLPAVLHFKNFSL
jgi:hypothetical protein